jgi:hypothetical protein
MALRADFSSACSAMIGSVSMRNRFEQVTVQDEWRCVMCSSVFCARSAPIRVRNNANFHEQRS